MAWGSVSAASSCDITATLTPGERQAHITSSRADSVYFYGNYTVEKPGNETGQVSFNATTSTGWVAVAAPASAILSEGSNVSGAFTITVVVPPGELATNVGQVTVNITGIAGESACAPAHLQAVVTPQPYWGVVTTAAETATVFADLETGRASADFIVRRTANVRQAEVVTIHVTAPPSVSYDAPETVRLEDFENGSMVGHFSVNFSVRGAEPGALRVSVWAGPANGSFRDLVSSASLQIIVPARPTNTLVVAATAGGASVSLGATVWLWRRLRGRP